MDTCSIARPTLDFRGRYQYKLMRVKKYANDISADYFHKCVTQTNIYDENPCLFLGIVTTIGTQQDILHLSELFGGQTHTHVHTSMSTIS